MPQVNVQGHQITFPEDMSHDEIIQAIERDVLPELNAHEAKTSMGATARQAFTAGRGALHGGIGAIADLLGMQQAAENQRAEAAKIGEEARGMAEEITPEDVAAAEAQNGPLAKLGMQARQNVVNPLAGMAGRFAPTLALSAIPGVGIPAALANEYLASTGEDIEKYGATPEHALMYAAPQAALNVLTRFPTGNLGGKLMERAGIGSLDAAKAIEEAAAAGRAGVAAPTSSAFIPGMAPEQLVALNAARNTLAQEEAGKLAARQAAEQFAAERTMPQMLGQFAQNTVGNAAVNIPTMIGGDVLGRLSGGQDILSPEAIEAYKQMGTTGALLAPIFGAGHTAFHDPVAARRAEAEQAAGMPRPEEIAARQVAAPLEREAKAQEQANVVQATPFHPDSTDEKLWEDLKAHTQTPTAPAYTDLAPEQQQAFAEGLAAKKNKVKPAAGEGTYEPTKNTVSAFKRIVQPPAEQVGGAAQQGEAGVAPTVRPVKPVRPTLEEWTQTRNQVATDALVTHYPDVPKDSLDPKTWSKWLHATTTQKINGEHPEAPKDFGVNAIEKWKTAQQPPAEPTVAKAPTPKVEAAPEQQAQAAYEKIRSTRDPRDQETTFPAWDKLTPEAQQRAVIETSRVGKPSADIEHSTINYGRAGHINLEGLGRISSVNEGKSIEDIIGGRNAVEKQKAAQLNGDGGKRPQSSQATEDTPVSRARVPTGRQEEKVAEEKIAPLDTELNALDEAIAQTRTRLANAETPDVEDKIDSELQTLQAQRDAYVGGDKSATVAALGRVTESRELPKATKVSKTPLSLKEQITQAKDELDAIETDLGEQAAKELRNRNPDYTQEDIDARIPGILARHDDVIAQKAKIADLQMRRLNETVSAASAKKTEPEPPAEPTPTVTEQPTVAEQPTTETPPSTPAADHAKFENLINDTLSVKEARSYRKHIAKGEPPENHPAHAKLKEALAAQSAKQPEAAQPVVEEKPPVKRVRKAKDKQATALATHAENPTPESQQTAIDAVRETAQAIEDEKAEAPEPTVTKEPTTELGKAVHAGDTAATIEHMRHGENPAAALVAEHAKHVDGLKVEVGDQESHYDRATNTVHINAAHADNEHVVTHEMAHAAISHAIDRPTDTQESSVKGFKLLYNKVKTHKKLKGERGIDDIHEFVSEGLSNPAFQDKLKAISYKSDTVWGRFTNVLANMLGFTGEKGKTGRNAFMELISHTEDLLPTESFKPIKDEFKFHLTPAAKSLVESDYTKLREEAKPKSTRSWVSDMMKKYVNQGYGMYSKLASHFKELEDGKLRADLLYNANANLPNVINQGRLSGVPVLQKDLSTGIGTVKYQLSNGKTVNASLAEMQRIADKLKDGRKLISEAAYILDTRAQLKRDPSKVGEHITGDMAKFREMEQQVAAARAAHPEIDDVLGMWREINKNLIHYAHETGLVDAKTRDLFLKEDDYMPRYAVREDIMSAMGADDAQGRKGGYTTSNQYVKTFRERTAAEHQTNVWENMAHHYASVVLGGSNNVAKRQAAEQLAEVGAAVKAAKGSRGGNFAVLDNGKRTFYTLDDPSDVPAMMAVQQELGPFMQAGRAAAQVLRAGVLNTPAYWYRQLVRDPIYASMVSDVGWVTPAHAMQELTRIMGRKSPEYDMLVKRGVIGYVDPITSVSDARSFAREIGKDTGKTNVLRRSAGATGTALEKVHAAVDGATRVAIYKAALKKATTKGLHGEDAVNYAVMKARESINFSVRGSSTAMDTARSLVPFLSASINGLENFRRAMIGGNVPKAERAAAQRAFMSKAATIGTLSAAYAMMMSTDEAYQDVADDNYRYSNFLMPTHDEKHPFIAMSLSPEVAAAKWIPEMLVRYTFGQQTGAQIAKSAWNEMNTMTPNLIPQIFKPAFEVVTNHSFLSGEPIEPKSEQNYETKYRGRNASEAAKALANTEVAAFLDLSPAEIDHLARGYGGELGKAALWGLSQFADVPAQETDWAKVPVIGMGSAVSTAYASKARDEFYEAKTKADEARNTLNDLRTTAPESQRYKDFVADPQHLRDAQLAAYMDRVAKQISTLNTRIQVLKNLPDYRMSSEDKAAKIDEIKATINRIAKQGNESWKRTHPAN